MQTPNPTATAGLAQADVVARLNELISSVYAAREECHERIRRALDNSASETRLADVLGTVDAYGAALEDRFNDIVMLKANHPAAWEDCEGSRQQRIRHAMIDRLVVDALATAFGFDWPSADPNDAQDHPSPCG